MFLILRKMIKYQHKENRVLYFGCIYEIKVFFRKRCVTFFINKLDFRKVPFVTIKL